MIVKINKIKNVGILEDFNWLNLSSPDDDFKKVNLIFGLNGTGKTTLSRIMRNFELGDICEKLKEYHSAEYELVLKDGRKIDQRNIKDFNEIRVFNKDFVEDTIFQPDREDCSGIQPIIYVGSKKIELAEERKNKKRKEKELKGDGKKSGIIVELKNKEIANDKLKSEFAKGIKTALFGVRGYENYDIRNFEVQFEKLKKEDDYQKNILAAKEEAEKLRIVKNYELSKKESELLKNLTEKVTEEFIQNININILNKEISITKPLKRLTSNEADVNSWVFSGLNIHKDHNSVKCKFCDQDLPKDLIVDLENHFDTTYREFITLISDSLSEIDKLEIPKVNMIENPGIRTYSIKLNAVLSDLKTKIIKKQANILESFSLDGKRIGKILEEISNAQAYISNLDQKYQEAILDIENSIVSSNIDSCKKSLADIQALKDRKETLTDEIKDLTKVIETKERHFEDIKLPATKINEDLIVFLGHDELVLVDEKDEFGEEIYSIKRGDNLAYNLSEGEKTAISLIYFLRKLTEKGFDRTNSIVLIDDPVTSMDSQFMYSAYSFIVSAIENEEGGDLRIAQFFLTTHNYDFFNLFKKKYKYKEKNTRNHYMLKIELNSHKKRISNIYKLDDLLRKFDSDYQYLFSLLLEFEKDPNNELEKIYPYPNIARRTLEIFLSFRFPSKTNYMDKLNATKANKILIESIYRFTNRMSHGEISEMQTFSLQAYDPNNKDRILDVLKLMREVDLPHCNELEKCQRL